MICQTYYTIIVTSKIFLVERVFQKVQNCMYRNDPKFSDRYAWANSADPDQTAPRGAV